MAQKKPARKKSPPSVQGTYVWHEIYSPDAEAAQKFYSDLIGWKMKSMDMGPSGEYRMFGRGRKDVGGAVSTKAPPFKGMPPHWLTYIGVDDVDATCKQAKKLGAKVMMEPMNVPPGRMAVLTDPQGAAFAVFTPSR